MERLYATRHDSFLEEVRTCWRRADISSRSHTHNRVLTRLLPQHIDYLSLQALLYKSAAMSVAQQVRIILAHSKRLADAA